MAVLTYSIVSFVLVTIFTSLISTSDGVIYDVKAKSYSCDHPTATEAAHALIVGSQPGSGYMACVSACYRHGTCTTAVYVTHDDDTATCSFLGSVSPTPLILAQNSDKRCKLYILNPCPAGVAVNRGYCQCPEGEAGQFCELSNPADCANAWTKVYSSSGVGSTSSVTASSDATQGAYLKLGLHPSGGPTIVLQSKHFGAADGGVVCSQMVACLTRSTWDTFESKPLVHFRNVGSTGTVDEFWDSSNDTFTKTMNTDWFVRQPYVPRLLYSYKRSGQATDGSLSDVVSAVRNGHDLIPYDTVRVDPSETVAYLSLYHFKLRHFYTGSDCTFASPPNWVSFVASTDGKSLRVEVYVVSGQVKSTSTNNVARELHVDPCWTRADLDRLGNGPSSGHLIAAVLNGQRTRVLVDDVAHKVTQVAVAGEVVVFDTHEFLDTWDAGTWDSATMVARHVVTTENRVFACKTPPVASTAIYNSTSTGKVTWFVDTRQWSRVFTVSSQGEALHGSEAALLTALGKGASLQIGLTFSDPGHFLLLSVEIVELTTSGHVMAQVIGVSHLPIVSGRVTSEHDCRLRAFIVTSEGSVRLYQYNKGTEGTHGNLMNLTIDWFVDTYTP